MNAKKIITAILETALRIIVLLVIISLVYKAGSKAYDFGYRVFAERPMTLGVGRDVIVTIPDGKGSRQIGSILVERGLIRDANLFFVQELLSAYHGKLKSGTYTLNTGMSSTEMMEIMSGGLQEDESEEEESESAPLPSASPDVSEEEPYVEDPLEETSGEAAPTEEDSPKAEEETGAEEAEGEENGAEEAPAGEEILPADVSIEVEGTN